MTVAYLHFTRHGQLAVLAFDTARGAMRSLSWSSWQREIGGKPGHDKALASGRIQRVDHVSYRRDGPPGKVRDELNRTVLSLDFTALLFLANGSEGVDHRAIHRLFEYREDGERALADLGRFCQFVGAAKLAMTAAS